MTEWLTAGQAADYLGITVKELNWRRWKRQITFAGRGELVRFKKDWLDAYIDKNTKVSKWEEKAKASNSEPLNGRKGSTTSRGQSAEKPTAEARGRQIAMKLKRSELPLSFSQDNVIAINHSR